MSLACQLPISWFGVPWSLSICLSVYLPIYMYKHIYIYISIFFFPSVYKCAHVCRYIHIQNLCTHKRLNQPVYVCMYVSIYIYIYAMHIHIHDYICTLSHGVNYWQPPYVHSYHYRRKTYLHSPNPNEHPRSYCIYTHKYM